MSAEPPTISLRVSAFLDRQESNLEAQISGHLCFSAVFKLFAFALYLVFFMIKLPVF